MDAFLREFYSPGDEYTAYPFWFLNGDLCEQKLSDQLEDFADKGVMGVVLHPRIGLSEQVGYLTERWMELITHCVRICEQLGMRVLIYDEAMYPSGSAHGGVARKNPEHAAKGIRLLIPDDALEADDTVIARVGVRMTGENVYAADSARLLSPNDALLSGEIALRVVSCFTLGTIRGVHAGEDDGEPNAPRAADLLNPDAVRSFIDITHEAYYAKLEPYFGSVIEGFFTDEPSLTGRCARAGVKPWTDGLDSELSDAGVTLIDLLALWLAREGGAHSERVRKIYTSVVRKRLTRTYYAQLYDWCEAHNVRLCGHPDGPEDMGELSAFHIPGQDVVWRWVAPEDGKGLYGAESTQAKCASDMARHTGRRRNLNECCGCCGLGGEMWAFTADDFKWYLDWLFVRGTNMIVPHAFYYEIDTPLKRDRPPDLGPNNYWWRYFERFSDYIRRMCMINTGSVNQARVAVLCLSDHLPYEQPAELYRRQIEFNYLPDTMLPDALTDGKIRVRAQAYDALLVEEGFEYTPEALDKVRALEARGLRVYARASDVPDEYRTLTLSGDASDIRVSCLKRGKALCVMLTNEGEREYEGDMHLPFEGSVARLDPWNGRAERLDAPEGHAKLYLKRRESAVFASGIRVEKLNEARAPLLAREIVLAQGWRMRLPNGTKIDRLIDWRDIPALANFSGELEYTCEFLLPASPARAVLDLGVVRELACVYINDMELPAMLISPYRAEVGGYLCAGVNDIRVRVANSRVPMFERKPWSGGLLGPVTLKYA